MTTRRDFFKLTATGALTGSTLASPALAGRTKPLRVQQRKRKLFVMFEEEPYPTWLTLYSDAPLRPRPIVKQAVLEAAFGTEACEGIRLPDHWEMIDRGWFGGDDLRPIIMEAQACFDDPAYWEWATNYHPLNEASDLIADAFDLFISMMVCTRQKELGLMIMERPCTPRLCKAQIAHIDALAPLMAELAKVAPHLEINPNIRAMGDVDRSG